MVLNLRSRHGVYSNFMQNHVVSELFPEQGNDLTHVSDLKGVVNPEILHARIGQEVADTLGVFSSSWSSDLQSMIADLDKSCPRWEPHRESLLDHPDMTKAMCENKRYGNIGPVCQELRTQLKLLKAMHTDNMMPLIDAGLGLRCKSAADFGVETVAFTYCLFTLTVTLPALDNQTLITNAVQKMRDELAVSKVPLTNQMEEKIKAWTSGDMLAGVGSAPSAPAAGSAPSAPAGTQPAGGYAPSAPARARPAAAGPSAQPAGGSAPSAPAGAQPGNGGEAKLSLADRMRIKKQRT